MLFSLWYLSRFFCVHSRPIRKCQRSAKKLPSFWKKNPWTCAGSPRFCASGKRKSSTTSSTSPDRSTPESLSWTRPPAFNAALSSKSGSVSRAPAAAQSARANPSPRPGIRSPDRKGPGGVRKNEERATSHHHLKTGAGEIASAKTNSPRRGSDHFIESAGNS
jgi:hypothetical protein